MDHTPFYAEGGGQVADHGKLVSFDSEEPCEVVVNDVQKKNGIWLHQGKVKTGTLSQNQVRIFPFSRFRLLSRCIECFLVDSIGN